MLHTEHLEGHLDCTNCRWNPVLVWISMGTPLAHQYSAPFLKTTATTLRKTTQGNSNHVVPHE